MPQPSNSSIRWPCSCGTERRRVCPCRRRKNATDLQVGAGLGKWEKRRIEARLHARSEKRFHGVVERALQIAERDVAVDRQPFDLMEDGRVRGVGCVVAVQLARTHHAHRRLHLFHRPNLHRRSVVRKSRRSRSGFDSCRR